MKTFCLVVMELALVVPCFAAESRLDEGRAKGFAVNTRSEKDGRVSFLDERGKLVITLPLAVSNKWRQYQTKLNSAYLNDPHWYTEDVRSVRGEVYRFSGGVIVDAIGRVTYQSWDIANVWW